MTDGTPEWYEQFADGNEGNLETLKAFENPEAFGKAFFEQSAAAAASADDNWRDPFSAGDEKYGKRLEKFTTPEDYGKSYRQMEQRISSGDVLKPLPENATDDDIKAFREQQGIPLEATGYLENLPEGLVIGEDDKPFLEDFLGKLHGLNVPPSVAHATIEWYNNFQEQAEADIAEQDKRHSDEFDAALRDKWGTEFRVNMNYGENLLSDLSPEAKEEFLGARMSDNRTLANSPEMRQWMTSLGRKLWPSQKLVPTGDGDSQTSAKARLKEIDNMMGTPAYTKDPEIQAEWRRLTDFVDAQEAA